MLEERIMKSAEKLLNMLFDKVSDPFDNWYAVEDDEEDECMLVKVEWSTDSWPEVSVQRDEYEQALIHFVQSGFFDDGSDISRIYAGHLAFWIVKEDRAFTRLARCIKIKDHD